MLWAPCHVAIRAGSELSSVRLVDELAAERQRVELINRLVKEAIAADFEGACQHAWP